jgi:hypothetical protein
MRGGFATTLEDAYAKAVRLNDGVWAQTQAEQVARQAEQAKAAAAKAAEAKRASAVNIRPVGAVSGSPARALSMRDTMAAVAAKYTG